MLIEQMNLNIINIRVYKCNANISADDVRGVLLPYPAMVDGHNLFCGSFSTQNERKLEIIIELGEKGDADGDKVVAKIGAYIEMVIGAGLAIITFHSVLE
jgi:hypothetical protein